MWDGLETQSLPNRTQRLGYRLRHGAASAHSAEDKNSIIVPIFVFSLIVPLYFFIGPIRFAPFLVVILALITPMCFMWATASRGNRIFPDYLILLYCLWATISLIRAHGISMAIEPSGILFIQTFGSYLIGRIFVARETQFRQLIKLHSLAVTIIFPFAIFETLTARPLFLEIFRRFGSVYGNAVMEPRMGLDRVQGAFEHPILYGLFVGSCFAAYCHSRKVNVTFLIVSLLIVVSVFASLSTGALLCIIVQSILILWGFF